MLTKELADTGTTANAAAPRFTETDMRETVPEAIQKQLLDEIPVNRFADPGEVSAAVRFLAYERLGYITGQVIGVNGGMHI